MIPTARRAPIALALVATLWGAAAPIVARPQPVPGDAAAVAPTAEPVVASPRYTYRLGAGDRLRIIVYGEDKLTGEYAVNGQGVVVFPLVGDVAAGGRSIAEFRAALIAALQSDFMRHPSVSVEVINFRPVYVLGEVAKPGSYPFVEGLTVYEIVSMAGGFTYRANMKRIVLKHEGETTETRVRIDSGTAVAPGDTIRVRQRFL